MNNNINNGVNSGIGGGQNVGTTVANLSNPTTVTNSGVVSTPSVGANVVSNIVSTPSTVSPAVPGTPVINAVPGANSVPNPTPVVNSQNNSTLSNGGSVNNQNGIATNTYVIVGSIVGVVILAAVILLVLLVTGVIGNRNRLSCTKTISETGYVYTEDRVYRFDNGPYYTKIDKVLTFDYANLTDEMYNEQYADLIDNPNTVSIYGFGTNIYREGNRVIITSYDPKIFDRTTDEVLSSTKIEGFTCD